MAVSINIANQALLELGVDTITSTSDETRQAKLINTVYDGLVDRVIAHGYYPSTIRRATLSQLSETPNHGYAYQYSLPGNPFCLRVVSVNETSVGDIDYKIEGNKLLTDESSIKIKYIARLEQEADMDPFLKEVLIYTLAYKICMPLTQDKQLKRELFALMKDAERQAHAAAGTQGSPDEINYSDILELR